MPKGHVEPREVECRACGEAFVTDKCGKAAFYCGSEECNELREQMGKRIPNINRERDMPHTLVRVDGRAELQIDLRASEIVPRPVQLIWRRRLMAARLNVIAGDPGMGKSTLGAMIAAELSHDGLNVIMSNLEDDPASVTRPRLDVAEADLEHIFVLPEERAPVLPRDLDALAELIVAVQASACILDPIRSHFRPETRMNDGPTIRDLQAVARETDCAIVAIHHTLKSDGRVAGPNSGLLGTARGVYIYGFDPDDEDRRALTCEKLNGAEEPPALVLEHDTVDYRAGRRMIEAGRLYVVGQSNARRSRSRGARLRERDAAADKWLTDFLSMGEDCTRKVVEIRAEGRSVKLGWETLRRAGVRLKVEYQRSRDGHAWRLPDDHPVRMPVDPELEDAGSSA